MTVDCFYSAQCVEVEFSEVHSSKLGASAWPSPTGPALSGVAGAGSRGAGRICGVDLLQAMASRNARPSREFLMYRGGNTYIRNPRAGEGCLPARRYPTPTRQARSGVHPIEWNGHSRKLRQAFIAWGCKPMYDMFVARYAHPCVALARRANPS
jgi:hypothetical protein